MKLKKLFCTVLGISLLITIICQPASISYGEENRIENEKRLVVDPASTEESSKDTLVIRINSDPASFDRHINTSYYAMMVQSYVCSYLVNREYDENGDYIVTLNDYSLATDYSFDDDNMGITFSIRDGVLFSNGDEMTPEDIVFSIKLFSDLSAYEFIDFDNVSVNKDNSVYIPFLYTDVQIPVDWCVHSRISGAPILK